MFFNRLNGKSQLEHVLVGFGFGPIQAGIFALEARRSGNFSRIVIAEIDPVVVDKVRANNGCYFLNIAGETGVETKMIDGLEMLNPNVKSDREIIQNALATATVIVTALPSVAAYSAGGETSIASLIACGLQNSKVTLTLIYTAENHNHAAEILEKEVNKKMATPPKHFIQYLNTVIGKMSQVVTATERIAELQLKPVAPGADRAFLVEAFDRILVTRNQIPGFKMGT